MRRTYWLHRVSAYEYTIGIATSREYNWRYVERDFIRVSRDNALHDLIYRHSRKQLYINVSIDTQGGYDRFKVARAIRTGDDSAITKK